MKATEYQNLLTPAQIAKQYSTTPQTVRNWYHAGTIPAAVSVGKIIRFDADEVAKALKAKTKKGKGKA